LYDPALAMFAGHHHEVLRRNDFIASAVQSRAADGSDILLHWRVDAIERDRVHLVLQDPEASQPIDTRTFDLGCQDW
jgi:hypothetical protein